MAYPANAFVLVLEGHEGAGRPNTTSVLREYAAYCMSVVRILQQQNVPHTCMLSADAFRWRLFLFPIRPFVKEDALEIGPSFPEFSGQMLVKRQEDFDAMSEQFIAEVLAKPTVSSWHGRPRGQG